MVAHVLGGDVAPDLQELIPGKGRGCSLLFIEEFVRTLMDMAIVKHLITLIIRQDIDRMTIPSTIQDVIMARVRFAA